MKKSISLFLVFFILALSSGLFADEQKYEFSLVRKKAKFPKEKMEFITLKRDLLLPYGQTLLNAPPVYNNVNLNFSRSEDFWRGAKTGAIVGGIAVAVLILFGSSQSENSGNSSSFNFEWELPVEIKVFAVGVGAVIGGLIGGVIATRTKRF